MQNKPILVDSLGLGTLSRNACTRWETWELCRNWLSKPTPSMPSLWRFSLPTISSEVDIFRFPDHYAAIFWLRGGILFGSDLFCWQVRDPIDDPLFAGVLRSKGFAARSQSPCLNTWSTWRLFGGLSSSCVRLCEVNEASKIGAFFGTMKIWWWEETGRFRHQIWMRPAIHKASRYLF